MIIDSGIVNDYLNDNEISGHWLFSSIEEGRQLFVKPRASLKPAVREVMTEINHSLEDFVPFNRALYSDLFPNWQSVMKRINVLLAVGCPPPYDAMVREHDGEEFVIFDLVRFNAYKEEGSDLVRLARSLITHESAHVCLHNRHRPTKDDYISKLKYITFDEGFAHFVSFAEDVMSFDFTDVISKYYLKSLCRLKCALDETDAEKRISLLVEANSGGYWDKYAAISGMLFLAQTKAHITEIYKGGADGMFVRMGII